MVEGVHDVTGAAADPDVDAGSGGGVTHRRKGIKPKASQIPSPININNSAAEAVPSIVPTRMRHTLETQEQRMPEDMKKSLMMMLSGMYGILLVVLGLVLPVAEIFADPNKPQMFEIYYVYLYLVSFGFLVYVYTYLLRKQRKAQVGQGTSTLSSISRTLSRTFSRSVSTRSDASQPTVRRSAIPLSSNTRASPNPAASTSTERTFGPGRPNSDGEAVPTVPTPHQHRRVLQQQPGSARSAVFQRQASTVSRRGRRRRIAYDPGASIHTGGFYLRVGMIAFGIGSMIHSLMTFGHYFEINRSQGACSDILQAIKPFCQIVFTFLQMYFVFMNSKMCVHKYKSLARFGLMHMAGTNICVWLRSLVVETLHVIEIEKRNSLDKVEREKGSGLSSPDKGSLPELNCQNWDDVTGKLMEKSSVYLYPCTIQYSLVCACITYIMWSNVGRGQAPTSSTKPRSRHQSELSDTSGIYAESSFAEDDTSTSTVYSRYFEDSEDIDDDEVEEDSNSDDDVGKSHRMSVDCTGSSKGLFFGIFLFVVSVVCIVCFYVLIGIEGHVTSGTILGHISENVIYVITLAATLGATIKMRHMHYSSKLKAGIEEILTLISLTGLILFAMFSMSSSVFYMHTVDGMLTSLTNLTMTVQACCQAIFTLTAVRASAASRKQVVNKPGRQYVTFLLVSNFALWVINTFETQQLEHNPLQVEFYGVKAWSIFSHISVPLGIYFRFHSTVALSNVWKKAWKMKHMTKL